MIRTRPVSVPVAMSRRNTQQRRRLLDRLSRHRGKLIFLAGNLALVGWVVFTLYGPLKPIRVSKETTFVTEPIHSSGYVDVFPEINRVRREGIPHDASLDADELLSVLGPLRDDFSLRSQLRQSEHWNTELDRTLDTITQAVATNQDIAEYRNWWFDRLDGRNCDDLRHEQILTAESILRGLGVDFYRSRLRYRLKRGDITGATSDVRNIANAYRFLTRAAHWYVRTDKIRSHLVGDLTDAVSDGLINPVTCQRMLDEIPMFDTSMFQRRVRIERLFALNTVFLLHAEPNTAIDYFGQRQKNPDRSLYEQLRGRWIRGRTDWNQVAMNLGRYFDAVEATLDLEPLARVQKLKLLEPHPRTNTWFRLDRRTLVSPQLTDRLSDFLILADCRVWQSVNSERDLKLDVDRLKVVLKVLEFAESRGRLPDQLADCAKASQTSDQTVTTISDETVFVKGHSGFALQSPDGKPLAAWNNEIGIILPKLERRRKVGGSVWRPEGDSFRKRWRMYERQWERR